MASAGNHAVSLAHVDEHGAEIVRIAQLNACFFFGCFAFAAFYEFSDHVVVFCIVVWIDDLYAVDVDASFFGNGLNFFRIAEKDRDDQTVLLMACDSAEDADVFTFWKYDGDVFTFNACFKCFPNVTH